MNEALKKALHKIVMKAYRKGQESVSKEHAVNHIVHDLADPNKKPQVPKSHVPAASESVLHKEMKPGQAISEMHNQKQMNAQAQLGMRPGQAPGKPAAAPKMGAMAAPAGAGAPAGASSGGGKPKNPKPLKGFMMRMSEKRGGGAKLAKQSPAHPGPSKSAHQKIHDAKTQAASEAHLKSPKGDAERKAGNAARVAAMKKGLGDPSPGHRGKMKGVHGTDAPKTKPGVSAAGQSYRDRDINASNHFSMQHHKVLGEMKQIKPNLPKSEGARPTLAKGKGLTHKPHAGGKHGHAKPGEKGVHRPEINSVSNSPGGSNAGFHAKMGAVTKHPQYNANAKQLHEKKLAELKGMKKPSLPKAEPAARKPLRKDAAPPPAPTPPPTVPGGSTINEKIGFPFGKSKPKK